MNNIRRAFGKDWVRIAEIEIFNYRLNFYPIFKDDEFYFKELSVPEKALEYSEDPEGFFVYDDGAVKGFIKISGNEVKKLFVEPVLQGNSIGKKLLDFAVFEKGANFLWALEKIKKQSLFTNATVFAFPAKENLKKAPPNILLK